MIAALRASAAHVIVDDLELPVPTDEDLHHLVRVLRLRDGAHVTVTDGAGRWRPTTIDNGRLVAAGAVVVAPPAAQCTIAAAIPKGDRVDWMVQKLTEVGATRIVLVHAARSVVRWDGHRAERQLDRLRRIAREAVCQSRRTIVPVIEGPTPLLEVLAEPGALLADPDGSPLIAAGEEPPTGPIVIGPEGGFDPGELHAAEGLHRVALGSGVLRVETAAVAAAILALARS